MINNSRTRNSLLRKRSLRKSRARKSPKRSLRKSRARKSPIRKRSLRKSRARKSPIRKRSVRKSRARKSPIRKRSLRKSRARKSPIRKRSVRKSRARKSPIRKRSVRKSTRRKSHSRVGKSVRHKSAHKSPRKSVRYKYSPPPKPDLINFARVKEQEEEDFKKLVKQKLENTKLYRCIRLGELDSIQTKQYMSSLAINTRQNVSVAKWIIHGIASQYSSTGKSKNQLINHPFCGKEDPTKKPDTDNTKEKPICMISINLSELGNYEIIIPSKYQNLMMNGKKVKTVERKEHIKEKGKVHGKVYTEFFNIRDETKGINVYDYYTEYTEIDEKDHYVEKRGLVKHTDDTVYLYPAFDRSLINRWISGLTPNQWDNMSLSASETVGEVVFCGNIPSKALRVVAERRNGKMELLDPVTIEEYTPPPTPDRDPPPDSKKRTRDDVVVTDMPPPPNRPRPKKAKRSSDKAILNTLDEDVDKMALDTLDEDVDIYDINDNKLGTMNKSEENFLKYLKDGVIKKVNGVDKYVVVINRPHEIYDKIVEKNMFEASEEDLRRNTNFKKLSDKEFLDTLPENIDIYDIKNDEKLYTMNKRDETFKHYLETKAIRFLGNKFVFIPTNMRHVF